MDSTLKRNSEDEPDSNSHGAEKRGLKNEAEMRSRTLVYTGMFGLPNQEQLVDDFTCAIRRSVILHGRMYVSRNYVCFFSNIISTVKVKIPIIEIREVRKENVAYFFPNGLYIQLKSGEEYHFTSMLSRSKCFELIQSLMKSEESPLNNEPLSVSPSENSGIETDSVSQNSLVQENDKSDKSVKSSEAAIKETVKTDPMFEEKTKFSSSPPDEHEPAFGHQMLTGTNVDFDNVFQGEFPISLKQFMEFFIDEETARFTMKDFYTEQGERNINVSKWTRDDSLGGYLQEMTFESDIKDAPMFVSKSTRIHRVQRYCYDESSGFVLDAEIVSLDVPMGDSFKVLEKWEVKNSESDHFPEKETKKCRLEVKVGVYFSRANFLKGVIASKSKSEIKASVEKWYKKAFGVVSDELKLSNEAADQQSLKELVPEPEAKCLPSQGGPWFGFFRRNYSWLGLVIFFLVLWAAFMMKIQHLEMEYRQEKARSIKADQFLAKLLISKDDTSSSVVFEDLLLNFWSLKQDLYEIEQLLSSDSDVLSHSKMISSIKTDLTNLDKKLNHVNSNLKR